MTTDSNRSATCTIQQLSTDGSVQFVATVEASSEETRKLLARYGLAKTQKHGPGYVVVEEATTSLNLEDLEQRFNDTDHRKGGKSGSVRHVGVERWRVDAQTARRELMRKLQALESPTLSVEEFRDPMLNKLFHLLLGEVDSFMLTSGGWWNRPESKGGKMLFGELIQLTTLEIERTWRRSHAKRLIQALTQRGLSLDIVFPPNVLRFYNELREQQAQVTFP